LKCISDDVYDPAMVQAANLELGGLKLGGKVFLLEGHTNLNTGFDPPIVVWIRRRTAVEIVVEPVVLRVRIEATELLIVPQRMLKEILNKSVGLRNQLQIRLCE